MTTRDTAASIPYEGTDCTPEEAVEAVKAVRATAAQPLRCEHGKTAMEDCLRCDPLNLLLWGRLPLATTLHLRERFRAYRDKPGAPDA